jgi:hypothetical protein
MGCASLRGPSGERARQLEAQSNTCEAFAAFETEVSTERRRVVSESPADTLLEADRALSRALDRCARRSVDQLFDLERREGRRAVRNELQALTRVLGKERAWALLQGRWGAAAAELLDEVELAAGDEARSKVRFEPTAEKERNESEECLHASLEEAAQCLAAWSRKHGATSTALDAAVVTLSQRAIRETEPLTDVSRASALATLVELLQLDTQRVSMQPLLEALKAIEPRLLPQARELIRVGSVEAAALVAKPFLSHPTSRAVAQSLCQPASMKHLRLAEENPGLAAQFHRALASFFAGGPLHPLRLPSPVWDTRGWRCQLPIPPLPALPMATQGLLVSRCRPLAASAASGPSDSSLRTFDLESSLQRLEVIADATVVCGEHRVTWRMTASEVLLEDLDTRGDGERPSALDAPLQAGVQRASNRCQAATETMVTTVCQQLESQTTPRLEASALEASLRLGQWPRCISTWFHRQYGVDLPPLPWPSAPGARRGE